MLPHRAEFSFASAGRSAGMALPSAWTAVSLGALGGFMMAYSHSSGKAQMAAPRNHLQQFKIKQFETSQTSTPQDRGLHRSTVSAALHYILPWASCTFA